MTGFVFLWFTRLTQIFQLAWLWEMYDGSSSLAERRGDFMEDV